MADQYPPQQPGPPPGQYPPQQPGQYPPPGGYQQGGYPAQAGYGGGPMSPQGRPLASWGKRVGAALIDALIVGIPAVILMMALGIGSFAGTECTTDAFGNTVCEPNTGFFMAFILSQLIPYVAFALYQTLMNGSESGQTVGKKVLKIQVRDEATGGPIGYGKAFLRWLVNAALQLFTCGIGGLLDVLWPLWDDKRQTLHDKVANSLVVETQ